MSYNDVLANANQNWTYDAAGNRISDTAQPGTWSYDNLNRMTASPGATYVHDVVGNRTYKAGAFDEFYTWDSVNRMTSHENGSAANYAVTSYKYRADGMRVSAEKDTQVDPWVKRTYYDGQMPIEEDTHAQNNPGLVVTQNFLGARGLEAMTTKVGNNAPTTSYPLYDVHGNMVATVQKSGSGTSWTIQDERSYDVWGSVRSGIATGGPRGRYCANLGHVQDDESGLVYMRARYYEPGSGRFISEDPAYDGFNRYHYCRSNPTNYKDKSGKNVFVAALFGTLDMGIDFLEGYLGINISFWPEAIVKISACMLSAREMWVAGDVLMKSGAASRLWSGVSGWHVGLGQIAMGLGLKAMAVIQFVFLAYQLMLDWMEEKGV